MESAFPNGMSGEDVLTKLELISDPTVMKLHKYGLSFAAYQSEQVAEATAFAWLNTEGETVGDIHLDNRTIQGAQGKMEIAFLKTAVHWGAVQVLMAVEGTPAETALPAPESMVQASSVSKSKVKKIQQLATMMMDEQKKKDTKVDAFFAHTDGDYDMAPFFPNDQLTTAEPVKLSAATQMYQPTRGTGASSRYFVVGISDECKVSARIKGVSVSIRVEGPAVKKTAFSNAMKSVGLSPGKGGEYASMHVEAPDPVTAQKAVGSVLSALPVQWKTPMPSVGHLQGLGS